MPKKKREQIKVITFDCAQNELDGSLCMSFKWDLIVIDLAKEIVYEGERCNCLHSPF